jgi:hypothetical protein
LDFLPSQAEWHTKLASLFSTCLASLNTHPGLEFNVLSTFKSLLEDNETQLMVSHRKQLAGNTTIYLAAALPSGQGFKTSILTLNNLTPHTSTASPAYKSALFILMNHSNGVLSWCIAISTSMVDVIIHWYHLVLGHVGIVYWLRTIATHFCHPLLKV